MTFGKLLLSGVAVATLSAVALAHSGATGVVKERMDAMKAMGEAVKRIRPMMSGEASYDAEIVRAAARDIAAEAGEAMTGKFPEGSIMAPSEALPRIWQEWDRFGQLAQELERTATGLALAAGNGRHADGHMMAGQSGMMGGGQSGMMGGGQSGMMGGGLDTRMTPDEMGRMPADGVFMMVTQTCSGCHDRYRQEDD